MSIWKKMEGLIGGSLQLGFTGAKVVGSGTDTVMIKDKDDGVGVLSIDKVTGLSDSSGATDAINKAYVTSGLTWTIRVTPVDNDWRSICYGDGLFVVVATTGTDNRVMTSPDGINWTIRVTPVDNDWRSICYGYGLFVAVSDTGTDDRVMTSPDGINWTIRVTPVDNNWHSVTYGGGLFVAVAYSGTDNRVMTSPDGINWTIRVTPEDNDWRSICYGNGLFVAVANSGTDNRVMTSPDGINWTIRVTPEDNNWHGVCYGNGLFVAVALTGTDDRVMTSPDGINWTIRVTPEDNEWHGVYYGNGLFVAVALTGTDDRVMTSPDGINWTIRVTPEDNNWQNVCYGNGLFVAVAYSGTDNRVMTSGKTEYTPNRYNNIYQGGMTLAGPLELIGDGEVQKEITIGAASWHLGSTSPAEIWVGLGYALEFAQGTEQHVHYIRKIPTDYKAGTDIEFIVCWSFDTEEADHYVMWELSYLSLASGEDPAGAGTNIWQSSLVTTADGDVSEDKLICTKFGTDLTGLAADDILILKFNRDSDDTHGTDNLNQGARLHSIHLHYISDKLGT